MNQETFNLWYVLFQIVTAVAAIFFAVWQTMINNRLKKLQDYIALNFTPSGSQTGPQILIYNVGKQNLYLHKFEAGTTSHSFDKPRLLAVGGSEKNHYAFPVQVFQVNKELDIKLYLTDESNEKYVSSGAYIFDTLVIQQQIDQIPEGTTPPAQLQIAQKNAIQLRAWTYKIKKFNWSL